jgi:hypothetical protein
MVRMFMPKRMSLVSTGLASGGVLLMGLRLSPLQGCDTRSESNVPRSAALAAR